MVMPLRKRGREEFGFGSPEDIKIKRKSDSEKKNAVRNGTKKLGNWERG